MSFDKNKAMRSAEKFLSQGKIRGAINEYQRVVENDPRDFSTLNILGDLYAKNHNTQEAIGCFTQVAEYYNSQGFSHKAIAVYNKISRIEPNSIEVSAKLAELYQSKGSIAEARTHYTALAEHYQRKGQKIEALAIWKQIAELDPKNTDIYLKIAETCWQEEQYDEAARAFSEAGSRFLKQEKFERALSAFSKTLEIKKNDLRAIKGSVKAQIGMGDADEAAHKLEEVLKEQPHNRDILNLLIDCYLDTNEPQNAERAIIRLVEQEPANYPKFLELTKLYLKTGDLDAATRVLAMSSEHLLVGGQADDLLSWTNEVLTRNPEHIEALRLLARYHGWQRNETALKLSLERLAETARYNESIEDEHFALSQLVTLAPQNAGFAQRLQEINSIYKFENSSAAENGNAVAETNNLNEVPQFENFAVNDQIETNGQNGHSTEFDFADVKNSYEFEPNGYDQNLPEATKEFAFYNGEVEETIVEDAFQTPFSPPAENGTQSPTGELTLANSLKLQKELDSIEFYIEQGYQDLAVKALDELEAVFGSREGIAALRARLGTASAAEPAEAQPEQLPIVETFPIPEKTVAIENFQVQPKPEIVENLFAPAPTVSIETDYASEKPAAEKVENHQSAAFLDELKSEFDLDADDPAQVEEDYETHYHLATAYKDIGLTENAIREFQEAINLVGANDGTRRFFQCANLLGHCFMEKFLPNAAITWFMRALEVEDLNQEEKHAIYYNIGDAHQADGEAEKALDYFEQLYAEDVTYRDVSQRIEKLQKNKSQS